MRAELVAAFKEAWHEADARGEEGHRTEAGIDAVMQMVTQRMTADPEHVLADLIEDAVAVDRERIVARAVAEALREAARYFEYEMSQAWGGEAAWFSTGNKVADVVASVLRERAGERP